MNIFNRKTKTRHIKQFEKRITKMLQAEYPQFQKVIDRSKLYGIEFTNSPKGIFLTKGYNTEAYNEVQLNHRTHFNLKGVSVYNLKNQLYTPILLNFKYNSLTRVEVENPERFHKNFDLTKVQINRIETEELPIENREKENAEKIFKSLTREQADCLELEDTFELDFDDKVFYTILDMEDGNYIAVDEGGSIYRLNHDRDQKVRKIFSSPAGFSKLYTGSKEELESIMDE